MQDREIIDQLFARSEEALKELDLKYGGLCQSIANNILNNRLDAQECVNDAYLGVWNSIPPASPDSLQAYLLKIVRNISLKKYRYNTAQKRNSYFDTALEELEDCISSTTSVEDKMIEKELTAYINKFLSQLKPLDRVVFLRRYYFADSYENIAKRTEISEKNVSVKLNRIRKKLREYLVKEQLL